MTHGPKVELEKERRQKYKDNKNGNMEIGKLLWRPENSGEIGPGPSGAVVHECT